MERSVLYYQCRIDKLLGRFGRENGRIVAKLQRKIRKLLESAEH